MYKTKHWLILIFSILIISATILTVSIIISERTYAYAKRLANQNQCVLEVHNTNIGGFPTEEYQCDGKPQLEQKLNSYLATSDNWGWFGLFSFVLIILVRFHIYYIHSGYI